MRGQFDDTARIVSSGEGLEVTGPAEWDPDESGAVIHVRVKQEEVVATGVSAYTPAGATTWSAKLTTRSGTCVPSPVIETGRPLAAPITPAPPSRM